MYLIDFEQKFKCRKFNSTTKNIGDLVLINDLKVSGFYGIFEFGTMALYPSGESLLLEINNKSWNLLDDSVETHYFHFYADKKTRFQVLKNGSVEFEYIYESWWANRDDFEVNEMAVSCEPENSSEDNFAYVDWVKFNQKGAKTIHTLWSENSLSL